MKISHVIYHVTDFLMQKKIHIGYLDLLLCKYIYCNANIIH